MSIILSDERVENLGTGFTSGEGPIWNDSEGFLLFSDFYTAQIYKYTPGKGVERFHSNRQSNGLTYDKKERLIAAGHGDRSIWCIEKNGSERTLVDRYQGKRLNSPNDIVVKSDGSIYFTDPGYGIKPEQQELSFGTSGMGVFRLVPENGELKLIAEDFDKPNGLAFSPDEKLLYIADSSARRHIRVFDVKGDGTIANGRIFAELPMARPSDASGPPDGFKVDAEGRVYVCAAGGVWIYTPAGKLLELIRLPEVARNCAFGDSDWRGLYLTARSTLYRVRLKVKGIPPWPWRQWP